MSTEKKMQSMFFFLIHSFIFCSCCLKQEVTHKITLHTTLIRDQIGQGLGFSIAGGKGSPPFKDGSDGIYISRITEGGLAHRDGKILVGDRVLVVCFSSFILWFKQAAASHPIQVFFF